MDKDECVCKDFFAPSHNSLIIVLIEIWVLCCVLGFTYTCKLYTSSLENSCETVYAGIEKALFLWDFTHVQPFFDALTIQMQLFCWALSSHILTQLNNFLLNKSTIMSLNFVQNCRELTRIERGRDKHLCLRKQDVQIQTSAHRKLTPP